MPEEMAGLTVIEEREPIAAGLTGIGHSPITGEVSAWLGERTLAGVDRVRARVALKLAAELDAKEVPAYAVAKLSAEPRSVMAEIEGATPRAGAPEVRTMLHEVLPR
jgi:hypothetical protein